VASNAALYVYFVRFTRKESSGYGAYGLTGPVKAW
jgi:hypothetical protein